MLILTREDIRSVLTMRDAIIAVEDAFKQQAFANVLMPVRTSIAVEKHGGLMLTMPAYIGGSVDALGQKLVTVYPDNPTKHHLPTIMATMQLLDTETGECLAIMEGAALTAIRTGAASAIATKYLAKTDSTRIAIFGAGAQAETQLEGVHEVRNVQLAKVFDPVAQRAVDYSRRMSHRLGIRVEPTNSPQESLNMSDIIICASTSRTPLFPGDSLKPGVHINAIGSHTPNARELDTVTVQRSKIVVDSREAVLKEAGDLLVPLAERAIQPDHIWAELGEVIVGRKTGRESDQEITLFKSVGIAIQDISTAIVAYRSALKQGRGTVVNI
jgi:alanine dehydrogenase